MKFVILIYLFLLNVTFVMSQTIKEQEMVLVKSFRSFYSISSDQWFDSVIPKIKVDLINLLIQADSYSHHFDSLEQFVKIIRSHDNKLRFYSFDEQTGGTWHDVAVFAQFETNEGVKAIRIDSDISDEPANENGWTHEIQYEINSYNYNGITYYLCFGRGTFGGGHYHNSIMVFNIDNNTLNNCKNCIEEKYQRITARRNKPIDLTYNTETNEIVFNEFITDEYTGFLKASGRIITLKFVDGTFVKQQTEE